MSVRNLDRLLRPKAVAFVGASKRPGSIGLVTTRNLRSAGFQGPIMLVNPHEREIEGLPCYPDLASLPVTPDLVLIATPPDSVPGLIDAAGKRGAKSAIVITAGFGEGDSAHGKALQRAMGEAARPHLLRIVGPNCFGVMVPNIGLNASFAHLPPVPGDIAFVAQSGAVIAAVLDWASARGIGFSHLVSLGDMADVDFGDMLDYLATDPGTRAVLLYVEAITAARKFMSAARACARLKPVIAIKAGRHAEAARAVASHTGALAGAAEVYDAAFRRAGILPVNTLTDLFAAVETVARLHTTVAGDRLAILSNGGGIAIIATDALLDAGGRLAALSPETMSALDAALPPTWSHGNPVDIIGDAQPDRYAAALRPLLADPGNDAVLVMSCPTAIASATDAARAVADVGANQAKPLLTAWIGERGMVESRALFAERCIPTYATPNDAISGFMHLVEYRRNQDELMQTPPALPRDFAVDAGAARGVIAPALAERREWLSEAEAKSVLAAYGIAAPAMRVVQSASDAATAAAQIGFPVALKIVSRDITHKSDVGGVILDLDSAATVAEAAAAMASRIASVRPDARIDGFAVERMVRRKDAHELIIGASEDPQFGPVILFGQGGVAVELLRDRALALPPLNLALARMLMMRTRVYRLLQGYRGKPAADLDGIALALVRVSQLVIDHPEIAEIDINPLLADASGVVALDARIRVTASAKPADTRLAIRPYPDGLAVTLATSRGEPVRVRPIRPEDEPALVAAFNKLSLEAVRFRFFGLLKELPHALAARLTQIDYDREMAFVATPLSDESDIWAVARFAADPDNERAEYAIAVRTDREGAGLGYMLLGHLVSHARTRGLRELVGDVLRTNDRMLRLVRELGFTVEYAADRPDVFVTRLRLDAHASASLPQPA